MRLAKSLLLLSVFLLSCISVFAVAPDSVDFGAGSGIADGLTIIDDDLELDISVLVIDNDSAVLNCTLYSSWIDIDDDTLYEDIPITDYVSVLNNTETFEIVDFSYYQAFNDIQPYNLTLSCTDGVASTNSSTATITLRSLFIYSEVDIAKSTINTIAKFIIALSVFTVIFVLVALYIWGMKVFVK